MPDSASVTIAMHFEGHVAPAAVVSLARLVHRTLSAGLLGSVTFSEGGVVDVARNHLIAQALQSNSAMTHVMWVDPNLVVPADTVERLVADAKQVVGGASLLRLDQPAASAYQLEPFRWLRGPFTELQSVHGLGFGCTLVQADVYRQLRARHRDEAWHKRFYGRSEDVFFFERCRELEIGVWFDPAVQCESAFGSRGAGVAVTSDPARTTELDGMPRVALAMPLHEAVAPCAVTSLIGLIREATARGLLRGLFFTEGLFYDVARNALVADVLASSERFTHILWIDSDMVVPANALDRLLEADKSVAGGLYHVKQGDLRPAAFELDPLRAFEGPLGGITRAGGFGLGCALVRTSVYEQMAAHFEDCRWHVLTHDAGEDAFFFKRCKEMGIEAWLDTALHCGHVRDQAVTTADWVAAQSHPGGDQLPTA